MSDPNDVWQNGTADRDASPQRREDDREVRRDRSRSPARNGNGAPREEAVPLNTGNNLHVYKAQIMMDPHTQETRGFGFVKMENNDDAQACIDQLSGTMLEGKTITVSHARRGRARTPTPGQYQGVKGDRVTRPGGDRYRSSGSYGREERPYVPRADDQRYVRPDDRRYDDRRYDDRRRDDYRERRDYRERDGYDDRRRDDRRDTYDRRDERPRFDDRPPRDDRPARVDDRPARYEERYVSAFSSWVQIMMGRFIAGWGVGALSSAVPVFVSETGPKEIRGSLVAFYQLQITFGILTAYCFSIAARPIKSHGGAWRTVVGLGWIWALILGIGILFMPESPRWLIQRGMYNDARKSLARVRGVTVDTNHVQYAFDEIAADVKKEEASGEGTWFECFIGKWGIPKLAYRTYLLMMLQALQQLTGANAFFYFGSSIFISVGLQDSFVTQIILGAVNFICTFLGIYVMERFGRRWPLIVGALWQSAWLFAFAAVGVTQDTSTKATGSFLVAAACMFILGYASTWAPGIRILTGETFPTRTRQKQAGLAVASNWTWNFLLAFFTPFIVSSIDLAYGFIFAGCNLFGAVFVYLFLYESSGLSLEHVNAMYGTPGLKAWHSAEWKPEDFSSRRSEWEDSKSSTGQLENTAPRQDSEETMRELHRNSYGGVPKPVVSRV
ncbi:hypothetical protein M231_01133 [Tremella mesenterica]|uniref:Major facilitator superfamily (MFS) profile domain-containing protein n=1 Tax=Tremella mesenterica TaxID=5217 RepID=A0A4Q1BU60_TREME|nr:hypothetical protein M231_01133 [Tremella mesenterica]